VERELANELHPRQMPGMLSSRQHEERDPIKHDMLSAARRYRYVLLVVVRAPEQDPRTPTSVLRAVSVPVSCVAPRSRL